MKAIAVQADLTKVPDIDRLFTQAVKHFGQIDIAVANAAALIADRSDVAVVSVDYRLAPEDPYLAALDDCYAALEWIAGSSAADYGIQIATIGVLGESVGGGLAAALALLTKDRGGPRLAAQFLDAPTVDDRLRTHSMRHLPVTPAWRAADSAHSWRYYLNGTAEPGSDQVPVYAAPARAQLTELEGLPPAWACTYQIDPTRDESLDYARLLIHAGVPTELLEQVVSGPGGMLVRQQRLSQRPLLRLMGRRPARLRAAALAAVTRFRRGCAGPPGVRHRGRDRGQLTADGGIPPLRECVPVDLAAVFPLLDCSVALFAMKYSWREFGARPWRRSHACASSRSFSCTFTVRVE